MADVRNHLVAMLEELAEPEADAKVIARAKATSDVAGRFIEAVKVEVDARTKLQQENLPPALEGPQLRAIEGGRR